MKDDESKLNKVTKVVKSKTFLIAVCVFTLSMLTIGVSYSSFFTVKQDSTNASITTGTLIVSYGDSTSASIVIEEMDTMSDSAGMAQSDSKVIYIQNTGTLDSTYTLTIGYDMSNFTSRSTYAETDVLTPLDYMMFAIYEYDTSTMESTLIAGPLAITDLPIYSINTSDSRYNRYSILFDTLGSTSTSNSTVTYQIKTWLSDKAIPSVSYTYYYLDIEVEAEVDSAKMAYNISGTLTDGTSTLDGATIDFHNSSVVVTTGSDGTFTLSGIYPGVYNVDITYNDVVYSGNLTVEEDTSTTPSVSLSSLGSTFSGTDIYNVAYTYGTTISKIIDLNGYTTYSSAIDLSDGGSLAPTYKLVGAGTENITGITITLDTTNITYTMSM